jgi:hypothetical protein
MKLCILINRDDTMMPHRHKFGLLSAVLVMLLSPAVAPAAPQGAACHNARTWEFVDAFEDRQPDCPSMPPRSTLEQLSCPQVEMAVLEAGCLPDGTRAGREAGYKKDKVTDLVARDDHPCLNADGGLPDDGRAHLAFGPDDALHLRCVSSAQSCLGSGGCQSKGACSVQDDECAALEDGDCQQASACKDKGACHAVEGSCPIPCKESLAGVDEPLFKPSTDYGPECAPWVGEDGNCADSQFCEEHGLCTKEGGWCVRSSDAECRASQQCTQEGKCTIGSYGKCRVWLDRDCRESAACEDEGRCKASNSGVCVRPEEADARCPDPQVSLDGRCRYPEGFDCSESAACEDKNLCASYADQHCDLTGTCSTPFVMCVESEEYCQSQPACAEDGICGAVGRGTYDYNKCHVPLYLQNRSCTEVYYGGCQKTENGCKNSEDCKTDGRCSSGSPSSMCRPTEPSHCLESETCKEYGNCGLANSSTYFICRPTQPSHCTQSTACKEEGFCHFRRGVCEKAADAD